MQFPKLTPLQSRFAASFFASACLIILYFSLTQPQFAYATELDSRIPPDHNHPIIFDVGFDENDFPAYEEETVLTTRAPAGVSALANNAPQNMNINAGETQNWVFPKEAVEGPHGEQGVGLPTERSVVVEGFESHKELRRQQSSRRVYITLNTCLQPSSPDVRRDTNAVIPPQLQVYLSQSSSNQLPGPNITSDQNTVSVAGGYAIATVNADDDVYVGVTAPNTTSFTGIWNYEIAASIDAPFHSVDDSSPNLFFVDGDNHAALLITNDTTEAPANSTVYQEWMKIQPPYGLFGHGEDDRSILGVQNSYCGLMNYANIVANLQSVQNQNIAGMTNRGLGGQPKEQFYVTALNSSSTYWGFLAMEGNSTASGNGVVGGGGKVWAIMNFTTKAENNCALMYNLSFCSEVAYAVPTNPDKFSPITGLPALAALYDSNAANLYQFFNYSLQQIPCNTTASAQYSLARTCDDCARAYKQWLCAVTIPRCEDYNNPAPWLKIRNTKQPFVNGSMALIDNPSDQALLNAVATNSSRNPLIDTDVQPGPYKEVLPCQDLCYDLVQSCPAALGFGCPYAGRGLEDSYGKRSNDSGLITCSYLGAAYYLSGAGRIIETGYVVAAMAVAAFVGLTML